MAYESVKNQIDAYIKANGVNLITGPVLNAVLTTMLDELGEGYAFQGVLNTTDTPSPAADIPQAWLASAGTYLGGSITVDEGELALITHTADGWSKETVYSGVQLSYEAIVDALGYTPADEADLAEKQDTIADLSAIRSGAALGSTSVQPVDIENMVEAEPIGSIIPPVNPSEFATKEELSQLGQDVTADISQLEAKVAAMSSGGFDLTSLDKTVGYYNSEGTLSTNSSYRTVFLPIDSVSGDLYIAVSATHLHFFNANKGWISCFANWYATRGVIKVSPQDIPAGTGYIAVCYNVTENVILKAYDANSWNEIMHRYPLTSFWRVGSPNGGTANWVSSVPVFPTRGAKSVQIRANIANNNTERVFIRVVTYNTVFLTTYGNPPFRTVDYEARQVDFLFQDGEVGFGFALYKKDDNDQLIAFTPKDFVWEDVSFVGVYPPTIHESTLNKLNGVDVLSLPNINGYYAANGTYNGSNASYRTAFIELSTLVVPFKVVGYPNFIHFFDYNKEWISCLNSWAQDGMLTVKQTDIPANARYVAICWAVARTYLKILDPSVIDGTQRMSPLNTYWRTGSARYADANRIAADLLIPSYGARSVKIRIDGEEGPGWNYYINCSFYNDIPKETSISAIPNRIGTEVKGTVAEFTLQLTEAAFCPTICRKDSEGNLVAFTTDDIDWSKISIERVFVPEVLEPLFTFDAYARNRDKEAALAAAVRSNKVANGSKDFMGLILTDSHDDAVSEANAVVMADNFEYIQMLIHCGDFCGNDATNFSQTRYNRLLGCKKPFYFVCGNHDIGNSKDIAKCITTPQFYTRYVAPLVASGFLEEGEYTEDEGYYYHDFTTQKIRLICLYEYDGPNDVDSEDNTKYTYRHGESIISKAQAQWFCGVLNSTPADYGIIVAMHNPFSPLADCVTTAKFNHPEWINGHGAQRLFDTDLLADIVDAWVNKSANYSCEMVLKGAASYLNTDGVYYTFNYDFSEREDTAKFICFIGGHVHEDCVWRHRNYPYQYQITPICSNSTSYIQCPNADIRRTYDDGPAKDSLTAIGFDKENQAIRLVKLGVNVTENMVARDYELIKTQEP